MNIILFSKEKQVNKIFDICIYDGIGRI